MQDEKLPDPLSLLNSISDSVSLGFYRENTNSANSLNIVQITDAIITLPVLSNLYKFLPKIIPQGIAPNNLSEYQITTNKNIIENIDTTDFKINEPGVYNYSLTINAFSDTAGIIFMNLVNVNDVIYNGGKFETFADLFTTSRQFTLTGKIEHAKGDIAKIRIGAHANGGGTITTTITNIHFSIDI